MNPRQQGLDPVLVLIFMFGCAHVRLSSGCPANKRKKLINQIQRVYTYMVDYTLADRPPLKTQNVFGAEIEPLTEPT